MVDLLFEFSILHLWSGIIDYFVGSHFYANK